MCSIISSPQHSLQLSAKHNLKKSSFTYGSWPCSLEKFAKTNLSVKSKLIKFLHQAATFPSAPWASIALPVGSLLSSRLTCFQGHKQTNYERGRDFLTALQWHIQPLLIHHEQLSHPITPPCWVTQDFPCTSFSTSIGVEAPTALWHTENGDGAHFPPLSVPFNDAIFP